MSVLCLEVRGHLNALQARLLGAAHECASNIEGQLMTWTIRHRLFMPTKTRVDDTANLPQVDQKQTWLGAGTWKFPLPSICESGALVPRRLDPSRNKCRSRIPRSLDHVSEPTASPIVDVGVREHEVAGATGSIPVVEPVGMESWFARTLELQEVSLGKPLEHRYRAICRSAIANGELERDAGPSNSCTYGQFGGSSRIVRRDLRSNVGRLLHIREHRSNTPDCACQAVGSRDHWVLCTDWMRRDGEQTGIGKSTRFEHYLPLLIVIRKSASNPRSQVV